MSGTFSHLTRNHARLVHTFDDGSTVTIDYRPASLTPRQIHRMRALNTRGWEHLSEDEQIELADDTQRTLADMLIDWDAKNAQGDKIPPTLDGLEDIPYDVQTEILSWLQNDQITPKASGSEKSPESSTLPLALPDPAPMTTSSQNAQNGTTPMTLPSGSE